MSVSVCGQDDTPLSCSDYGHAHNFQDFPCFGLICIESLTLIGKYERIKHRDGSVTIKITKPSHILKHEYAHILAYNQMHTQSWLNALKNLGGHIKRYTDNWNFWKSLNGV